MKILFLLFFIIPQIVFSQQFADKEYYLIDSLILKNLSDYDKEVIDSCLVVYHGTDIDTNKLQAIFYISNVCWDLDVLVKYNTIVYNEVKDKYTNSTGLTYKTLYGGVLNNFGYVNQLQGNVSKSLNYYQQSLIVYEKIDYKEGVASLLNNIASIYQNIDDIQSALEYFEKALKIYHSIDHVTGEVTVYNNIGKSYEAIGDLNKSLESFNIGKDIAEENNDLLGLTTILNNMAGIFIIKGNQVKAMGFYTRALSLSKVIGDKEIMSIIYSNMGELHFNNNEILKAKKVSNEAYKIGQELGSPKLISKSTLLLSKIAHYHNDYKEAFEMKNLYLVMRDSVENMETQKLIFKQQSKYKYEAQKIIDDIKNEKLIAIEVTKKEKQKLLTYGISIGLVLIAIFLVFVFNRLRNTKKQKGIIQIAHDKITDSISYAKYLQNAILPSSTEINKHFEDNFILYKPKDIVSGDFYWFENKVVNNKKITLIAAADSTGHGVPGAMVSVVCSNALNRTVNELGIVEPAEILNNVRELVIKTFANSGENIKEGMDIALCAFQDNKVIFSGANNPLWIIRKVDNVTKEQQIENSTVIINNKALLEFKGNKQPIGFYEIMKPFTQVEIQLMKGDLLYFFSDGFSDQFGGDNNKRYKNKFLKKLLIEVSHLSMTEQKELINQEFEKWKGDLKQIDDVCIIGVKPIVQ